MSWHDPDSTWEDGHLAPSSCLCGSGGPSGGVETIGEQGGATNGHLREGTLQCLKGQPDTLRKGIGQTQLFITEL